METYDLLTRTAAEVVTQAEARELAENPEGKRAYVGYEPSGVLHLGHLLAANKLIDLQEAGFEVVVLLADVHAYLNGKGSFEEIQETAEVMREQFLAYGLDPDQTEFVLGSSFQLEEDYALDLHALELETTLSRAERAMADIQSAESSRVSHVVYPLMQALDIVYLDVDLAIGGMEQRKVHMLARDTLPDLGYDAPTALHMPLISDLSSGDGKMSSSEGVTLSLEDDTESIQEKVNGAFCPPTAEPESEDGSALQNPVLELFEYHVFPRTESVTVERPEEYGGNVTYESATALTDALESGELHPADAKGALARELDALIAPGRETLQD